ncbi:hypothetical protein N7492_001436 [Penicillium capsulatum]|uniref:Uncharacterized protein n=1 Tax=Penicillium capsulatum TaxID=69766 RepID=A0A9W9LZV9_9EURO|nr:hypothetical protein N7492_001436 [Penicillium capsulatum]
MCSYDCSGPPPPLRSDNDINGIGVGLPASVIINYLATAGIAVLVILIYYFAVYEPALDAFSKLEHGVTPTPFRPNPVDVVLLQWVRYLPRKILGTFKLGIRNPARLDSTFIKCFLAMSDLQIVTGFSILISGFAQFPCGLATYYWMLIVEMAWFSSLTHLSCLTLLRSHLYNRTTERAWRLFAMGAMAGLLVIGLVFTGRYTWAYESAVFETGISDDAIGPSPLDPAICYLDISAESTYAFWSMLFSVALIIMAYVSRVIKLHRTLSIGFVGRVRSVVGIQLRKLLRIVHTWSNPKASPESLSTLFCYRPLFASYLAFRALLDGWTSMGVEVGWLLLAFGWGISRLMNTINYQKYTPDLKIEDDDSGDWSFGQVVAMVLLAAPIITILEYFDHSMSPDIPLICPIVPLIC